MRTTILSILLCLTFGAASSQFPVPDTVITDTMLYVMMPPTSVTGAYCSMYDCPPQPMVDYAVSVSMPGSFFIVIFGTEASIARLSIYDASCSSVLSDTCGEWFYPDNIQMRDTIKTGGDFVAVVTTPSSGIAARTYMQVFPVLNGRVPVQYACPATGYDDGLDHAPIPASYHRLDSGKEESIPLPPGIYIETREGKRRLLFAR